MLFFYYFVILICPKEVNKGCRNRDEDIRKIQGILSVCVYKKISLHSFDLYLRFKRAGSNTCFFCLSVLLIVPFL